LQSAPGHVRFKPPRLWSAFITLRDAAKYTAKLPEALILVAKCGGPAILARIGGLRSLNRNHVHELNPTRKDPGQRKLNGISHDHFCLCQHQQAGRRC
jgi:hypothetical protein